MELRVFRRRTQLNGIVMTNKPFSFARPLWLGEVDSTNSFLRRKAGSESVDSGYVVAAHRQTAARGRMGNRWHPGHGDILFSLFWRGMVTPLAAGALPMGCALGVRDFLSLPPWKLNALCKWPNDVLVHNAKICGILTEGHTYPDGTMGLIVGIGVNMCTCPERDQQLGKKTASVEELTDWQPEEPEATLPLLLKCLTPRIREWETGGAKVVVDTMSTCLWGKGKQVRARTVEGRIEGFVSGIGENAELLLETTNGSVAISSVNALESGWE